MLSMNNLRMQVFYLDNMTYTIYLSFYLLYHLNISATLASDVIFRKYFIIRCWTSLPDTTSGLSVAHGRLELSSNCPILLVEKPHKNHFHF